MGGCRSAHGRRYHARDVEVRRRRGDHGQPRTEYRRSSSADGDFEAAVRRLHVGSAAGTGRRLMLMRRALTIASLLAVALLVPALPAAKNVAITNVKIIVGSGQVIDAGTIIVRDGKIATVTGGSVQIPAGLQLIDAKGMSAMPGFIDGHKHLADGPTGKAWMQ